MIALPNAFHARNLTAAEKSCNVPLQRNAAPHVGATGTSITPPNDTLNQLQAASRASGDAARPLPRLTIAWRKRTATVVTPSQMSQPRRFSAGPEYRRIDGCLE